MPQITNVKNIPLKRLVEIRDNDFRSKDGKFDYCPFEVSARIAELGKKHGDKAFIDEMKQHENRGNPAPKPFVDLFKIDLRLCDEHGAKQFYARQLGMMV